MKAVQFAKHGGSEVIEYTDAAGVVREGFRKVVVPDSER